MITPTPLQITEIADLLNSSIQELINHDSDIFNIDLIMPQQISEDARILNRELHETAINHRLAYYIEKNIQNTELRKYNVDIEYNRYYQNEKLLETVNGLIAVRPDIIIHSRMNDLIQPQHYLIIEAKKWDITVHDINKVKGFISDGNYFYVFGFTISYCSDDSQVVGNLYYFDGQKIVSTPLNVRK